MPSEDHKQPPFRIIASSGDRGASAQATRRSPRIAIGTLFRGVTECITVSLTYTLYKEHFLDKRPAKMHQTSQSGICFLAALNALSKVVIEQGPRSNMELRPMCW